jgi:hypothetical protein
MGKKKRLSGQGNLRSSLPHPSGHIALSLEWISLRTAIHPTLKAFKYSVVLYVSKNEITARPQTGLIQGRM